MNVCFLLTHVPNPRINKRIDAFEKTANVTVVCVRRASQNIWEPTKKVDHIIFDIDLPSAKHIIKRYFVSLSFQKKALSELNRIKPDIIYAEGLDPLLIAQKYKQKHDAIIISEVADLRENYIVKPKKTISKLFTNILLRKEKKAYKDVDMLVVTSPKFYDLHYCDLMPKDRTLFIPNMPDNHVFESYQKSENQVFTVGFIGGIRYLKQMKMLVDASEETGIHVLFAGAGGTSSDYSNIKAYCEGKTNVIFSGKYNYDSEIAQLYGRVDCVYSVYDADNPNVKVALPNKLYESVICELPIIVAKGTYLSDLVEEWGVGVSVSHHEKKELIDAINHLKPKDKYYQTIVDNCHTKKESIKFEKYQNDMINEVKKILMERGMNCE